ncbi:SecDF P1 head subdomain-containing protein [Embleya sp. NPDC001921]
MTEPSRTRLARTFLATAAAAVLLTAAGCSSDDPVRFKDGDRSDSVDGVLGRDFADVTLTPEGPLDARQLSASADIMRKRAATSGLSVKDVTVRDGTLVLRVSLTEYGAETKQRIAAIARTGQLTVRSVTSATPFQATAPGQPGASAPAGPPECADPATPRADVPGSQLVACDAKSMEKYVLAPAVITGTDVSGAEAQPPRNGSPSWDVEIEWTAKGQDAFTRVTSEAAGGRLPTNRIAIVCDGRLLIAPTVQSAIPGAAVINGTYNEAEARQLAATIGAGTLPAGFTVGAYVEGR